MQSIPYRVLAIDNTTHTLKVVREEFWNTYCPRFFHNACLDAAHFSYGADTEDLILYYGCNTLLSSVSISNNFTCSINGSNSLGFFLRGDSTSTNNSSVSCNTSILVRINQAAVEASEWTSSSMVLTQILDSGFGLLWEANNTYCNLCLESGGRCESSLSSGSFVCYCSDQPHALACSFFAILSAGMITLLIITIYCLKRRCTSLVKLVALWKNGRVQDLNIEAFLRQCGSLAPKQYRYSETDKMTNSFKKKLGQGGYGVVFKGKLYDGRLVAVKVLTESKGNGEEFINEVVSISKTSHVNVVALLGFCFESNRRALVYEFMAKGSLDKFIYYDNESLSRNYHLEWGTLYQIAVGIAQGLEYLHRGYRTRNMHFDVKPHNILLDEHFCPKISDFGLAKLCQSKESIVSMLGARGTAGYVAPEVFSRTFGKVSHKFDVYSYGMLVLDMTGAGEKFGAVQTSEIYFPHWIYERLKHNKDLELQSVSTSEDEETARKMILVGLWCIQTNPLYRPAMSKVLEMLEGYIQSLPFPPKPFLFSPARFDWSAQGSSKSLSTMYNAVAISEGSLQSL